MMGPNEDCLTIRAANEADTEAILDLYHEAYPAGHPGATRDWVQEQGALVRMMVERLPQHARLGLRAKRLEGFSFVYNGHLFHFYIASRGLRHGSDLMAHLQSEHDVISLDVAENNAGAIRFYGRAGFRIVSEGGVRTGAEQHRMVWTRSGAVPWVKAEKEARHVASFAHELDNTHHALKAAGVSLDGVCVFKTSTRGRVTFFFSPPAALSFNAELGDSSICDMPDQGVAEDGTRLELVIGTQTC
ncbi:MAG TPA: hypothetical protein VH040_16440 [Usitatibacter sp.]|jgi:hypothetical protein|nr:hypothetical protein [Usitatibacter sp.]